jgi:glucose/mannose-6-phosphate isomerase
MVALDDPSSFRACDPSGMLKTVLALPAQLLEAWERALAAPISRPSAAPAHVVALGMGGSAIAADLAAAYLAPGLTVPMVTVREARLPAYVGRRSAVIATSYSGETEETLAGAEAALRAGAHLVAITSGGRLAALAAGGTTLRVRGGLQPRAALAYLLAPTLAVLERWGLAGPCGADVDEAIGVLGAIAVEAGPDVPLSRNPAKRLAETLHGVVPAVYAGAPSLAPVARRWKTQFNENSKALAAWDVFPELTHNEVVGWGAPRELARRVAAVILLGGDEEPRDMRRIRIARDAVLDGAAAVVHEVRARGTGRLARLLSLVFLGDLASVYLAYLRDIDPTPVEAIDRIKRRMQAASTSGQGDGPGPS